MKIHKVLKNFFSDTVKTHLRSLIKQINLKEVLILDYNFCCTKTIIRNCYLSTAYLLQILEISTAAVCLSSMLNLTVVDLGATILLWNNL